MKRLSYKELPEKTKIQFHKAYEIKQGIVYSKFVNSEYKLSIETIVYVLKKEYCYTDEVAQELFPFIFGENDNDQSQSS